MINLQIEKQTKGYLFRLEPAEKGLRCRTQNTRSFNEKKLFGAQVVSPKINCSIQKAVGRGRVKKAKIRSNPKENARKCG